MTLFRPRFASPGRRSPDPSDAASILPTAVRRDVLIAIALKLLALAAIYAVFFAPHAQPEPTSANIAAHLLDR